MLVNCAGRNVGGVTGKKWLVNNQLVWFTDFLTHATTQKSESTMKILRMPAVRGMVVRACAGGHLYHVSLALDY
jgi:hypothetical protein